MSSKNMYDIGKYIAEVYDQIETFNDDIIFIKNLINTNKFNILEPFCGTGRISLPLAKEGHRIVGIDSAKGMLDLFEDKINNINIPSERVKLIHENVLSSNWPKEFDMVILGCNCFYELANSEEQELCIKKALQSLRVGGYLYIDNDHMEGDLDLSWQELGVVRNSMCGISKDGSIIETTRETVWYDVKERLAKFKRKAKITKTSGEVIQSEFIQQKHPVSTYEVQSWLENNGFEIIKKYGTWNGDVYTDDSPRSIFWATKKN